MTTDRAEEIPISSACSLTLHIHDLRGRTGVDKLQRDGLEGAKDLLGHRSIKMTEHYVDGKSERRVKSGRRR